MRIVPTQIGSSVTYTIVVEHTSGLACRLRESFLNSLWEVLGLCSQKEQWVREVHGQV